jgi:hypothetical protein
MAISLLGLLAPLACLARRFGPTIARLARLCAWRVAWAPGSQGGCVSRVALLILGTLA